MKQRRTPSTDEDGDNDDAWVSSAEGELILDVRAISPPHKPFPHTAKHIFLKNWTPLEQFMTVRKTLIHRPPVFFSLQPADVS